MSFDSGTVSARTADYANFANGSSAAKLRCFLFGQVQSPHTHCAEAFDNLAGIGTRLNNGLLFGRGYQIGLQSIRHVDLKQTHAIVEISVESLRLGKRGFDRGNQLVRIVHQAAGSIAPFDQRVGTLCVVPDYVELAVCGRRWGRCWLCIQRAVSSLLHIILCYGNRRVPR